MDAMDRVIAEMRFPVPHPLRVLWADEEMGLCKLKRRLKRLVAGLELPPEEVARLDEMLDDGVHTSE